MFRRFMLCVTVVAGLAVAGSCSTAEAGNCYRSSYGGGYSHYHPYSRRSAGYYHPGRHTYYRAAPVVYHRSYYPGYPVYHGGYYGSGYRSNGISFSVGF